MSFLRMCATNWLVCVFLLRCVLTTLIIRKITGIFLIRYRFMNLKFGYNNNNNLLNFNIIIFWIKLVVICVIIHFITLLIVIIFVGHENNKALFNFFVELKVLYFILFNFYWLKIIVSFLLIKYDSVSKFSILLVIKYHSHNFQLFFL
jgi:hypothetical protein